MCSDPSSDDCTQSSRHVHIEWMDDRKRSARVFATAAVRCPTTTASSHERPARDYPTATAGFVASSRPQNTSLLIAANEDR